MCVSFFLLPNDNIHARFTAQRPCVAAAPPPSPILLQHAAVSHRCYFAAAAATITFVWARETVCELKSSRKFPAPNPGYWLLFPNKRMTYFNRISCGRALWESFKGWKCTFKHLKSWLKDIELVYIIRTWKFVEIKCMRDCVCVCVCVRARWKL